MCCVRVNNREYTCDDVFPTEKLAREKAAESAYNICYHFSVNDGMYPGQRAGQAGVKQGLPVAIGTGRGSKGGSKSKSSRNHSSSSKSKSGASSSDYYTSQIMGGPLYANSPVLSNTSRSRSSRESSPRTSDSDLEHGVGRRGSNSSSGSLDQQQITTAAVCYCGRGYIMQHSRCGYCLRELRDAGYC